jgi:hypothetical protein
MRGRLLPVLVGLVIVAATGCAGGGPGRRVAVAEPGAALPGDADDTVVVSPPARGVTFVDRHPLFSKPRDYYENSGNNKFVKTMAAGVVGVPAGIVGELKQIVVGRPAELR